MFLFDIFNQQYIDNETNLINEIDTILMFQLNKMGNLFVTTFEGFLMLCKEATAPALFPDGPSITELSSSTTQRSFGRPP